MRVIGQPEDNSLDFAVVIPSHQEGTGILDTLHSCAMQQEVMHDQWAVFVVINNARSAAKEVLDSNRETHEMVEALRNGSIPAAPSEKPYSEVQLGDIQDIINAKLRLCIVDLWSQDHAPETCNVGIARDIGGKLASKACKKGNFFHKDGTIFMTDADTLLHTDYMAESLAYLGQNREVGAVTGTWHKANHYNSTERSMIILDDLVHYIEIMLRRMIWNYHFQDIGEDENTAMNGASMTVRKTVFDAVGGIPHIGMAEDSVFSLNILNAGYPTRMTGARYSTEQRISFRTPDGYGRKLERLRTHGPDYNTFPMLPFDAALLKQRLLLHRDQANSLFPQDETRWKQWMRSCLFDEHGITLSEEETNELFEASQKGPNAKARYNYFLLETIKKIVETRFEKIPAGQLVRELSTCIRNENDREAAGIFTALEQDYIFITECLELLKRRISEEIDKAELPEDPGPEISTKEDLKYTLGLNVNEHDVKNKPLVNDVLLLYLMQDIRMQLETLKAVEARAQEHKKRGTLSPEEYDCIELGTRNLEIAVARLNFSMHFYERIHKRKLGHIMFAKYTTADVKNTTDAMQRAINQIHNSGRQKLEEAIWIFNAFDELFHGCAAFRTDDHFCLMFQNTKEQCRQLLERTNAVTENLKASLQSGAPSRN